MQLDPYVLSEKFLKAVDGGFNVVDMPAMLDIMSKLEQCTSTVITKEILEKTRIGRHVNEMRRHTQDPALAKRAKNLVKRWLALLPLSSEPASTTVESRPNGQHMARITSAPVELTSTVRTTVIASGSIASTSVVRNPPYKAIPTAQSGDGVPSNIIASGRKKRLKTDSNGMNGPAAKLPKLTIGTPVSPALLHVNNGQTSKMLNSSLHPAASSPAIATTHGTPTLHRASSVASIGSGSETRTPRTGKVRSTAEILENVISSTGINLSHSETARKIALNQIVKEKDEEPSIVPAGAKPRPRKKQVGLPPPASDAMLNRTKDDLMRKFLASSADSAGSLGELDVPSPNMPRAESQADSTSRCGSERSFKEDANSRLLDLISSQPPLPESTGSIKVKFTLGPTPSAKLTGKTPASKNNAESHQPKGPPTLEELWARLPPLDDTPVETEDTDTLPPAPASPTPANVERYRSTHWAGVNGTYNYAGDWRRWTQTTTMYSYRKEPLHILPYVNVNEDNLYVDM